MMQIIKNAKLINGDIYTIVIKNGKIMDMTNTFDYDWKGEVIILPEDVYVSPGWIDLHTHAFPKYKPYYAHPDEIGYTTGVTTVVDAGSSGADDVDEFHEIAEQCTTNVLSFLNVSRVGLKVSSELADLKNISLNAIYDSLCAHPDMIVGLKARMSESIVGNNGIKPLIMAKEISNEVNLPLMVHIGNAPPKLADILPFIDQGDIITHCFNGKRDNHIFIQENMLALKEAIKRGIVLDIGHGSSSFSFDIAKRAKSEYIFFDTISTDIYQANQINGPVYDMATTLTKFLALGYTLEDVIKAVTEKPANIIKKKELSEIKVGSDANLTFFSVEKKKVLLKDTLGNELTSSECIVPYGVFLRGCYYNLS